MRPWVRHTATRCLTTLWISAALLAPLAAHAGYVLSEVSRAGADSTALFDINNSGLMVGYSTAGTGLATETRGFVTADGLSFTELSGPAGAVASFALGISDGGIVVGSFHTTRSLDGAGNLVYGSSSGFLYSGGSYTQLSIAGATNTYLRGISADGRYLTGYYSTSSQPGVGFVYDVVQSTLVSTSSPSSVLTIMQGVNTSGVAVGSDILGDGTRPGLVYDTATGTRTEVSIAGSQRTALRSIEEDGTLAGWYTDALGDIHGFVGSLADFEDIDFVGASRTFVEGSNGARILVGNALVGDRFHAFVARPVAVPEPAAWLLLATAAALATQATRQRHCARRPG